MDVPPSKRMREALDIAWAAGPKTFPLYIDLSQCISRKKWGSEGFCLTTTSLIYDFEMDQVWSPKAHLALQGHPVTDLSLEGFSQSDLKDLAGEGMFIPCVGMLMLAIFLNPHSPWWAKP
jgi:hypothetical protein